MIPKIAMKAIDQLVGECHNDQSNADRLITDYCDNSRFDNSNVYQQLQYTLRMIVQLNRNVEILTKVNKIYKEKSNAVNEGLQKMIKDIDDTLSKTVTFDDQT